MALRSSLKMNLLLVLPFLSTRNQQLSYIMISWKRFYAEVTDGITQVRYIMFSS